MPCYCSPIRLPAPVCSCSWPPKSQQCYCRRNSTMTHTRTCQNYTTNCPCTAAYSRFRQPPLRTMQKALVDKWTEIEKLGQQAHMCWCQHRALRKQLAYMQAKYCRLQKQDYPDTEPIDHYGPMRCQESSPSVYQGMLRIRERESTQNQLCVCNNPETSATYRGVVRVHDQDEAREMSRRPKQCGMDYTLEAEKLQTECALKELNDRMNKVNKCEEEIHERLGQLREELEYLQTKIKSSWGQNALDKCTPAKENQTRFF